MFPSRNFSASAPSHSSSSQKPSGDMADVQHHTSTPIMPKDAPIAMTQEVSYFIRNPDPNIVNNEIQARQLSTLSSHAKSSAPFLGDVQAGPEYGMELSFEAMVNDEDIFSQFLDVSDVGDPFYLDSAPFHPAQHVPNNDGDFSSGASVATSSPVDTECHFKSPYPWLRDWSLSYAQDDSRHTKLVRERAFALPSADEIQTSIMLYFTYMQARLPVLNEREFHQLLTEEDPKPISLALLYAVLFVTTPYLAAEGKKVAGYNTIFAATCEFYSRAALLLKLGCEDDPLRRVQVCLLLSTYRSYENRYYENERYVTTAYDLLVENNAFQQSSSPLNPDQLAWKRKTSRPEMFDSSHPSCPKISVEDFQEDCSFSWYLSKETKQQTYRLFVAIFQLQMRTTELGKLLVYRTALYAPNQTHSQTAPSTPEHLSVENVELKIDEWRQDNRQLLDYEPPYSSSSTDFKAFKIAHAYTMLSYEYFRSELYQTTLIVDKDGLTSWAMRLREASRMALRESVAATVAILESLEAQALSAFLPPGSLCCVMIPMTIFYVQLKTTSNYDPLMLEKLAMCSRVTRTLSSLHDPAGFFHALMNATLAMVDRYRLPSEHLGHGLPGKADDKATDDSRGTGQTIVPLPGLNLHSSIIRLQNLAYAKGVPESASTTSR
ncbi:uncharacterized protein A1O9_09675 [Exophiala aquamarina CBS 119918]|uniref:Xylanolytic transcriptional activator regulatory domain-containing protein n=1 Tax=Exophiala aquamarina CBS 119918 TaxID=1182545 RepID=A0A072P5D9_9EURO|nr:uncharacterized protein A1O9_09675 [Exophiala aquamarina CBS 119918]KEF54508.1 hypothetical protein A1O9_09675 [Exophiala aquamarina CBS 119918]